MMNTVLWLLGQGFLGVSLWMVALWLWQKRSGNAAVVDVGWTLSLPALHLFWAMTAGQGRGRALLLAFLVCLWGMRLAGYLYWTRLRPGIPEEGRYQKLRQQWGADFQRNLFWFYQAQAGAALVLAAVFLPVYLDPRTLIGYPELAGVGLFLLGWAGVTAADSQLSRYKASGQRGVCQAGLWYYSRHPNYFFEFVLWTGWASYGLASPGGAWALLAPLSLLHLLLNVTGIPPTEAQALRSKGEAYRDYQRTTSAFVPWFRKA